MAGLVPAIHDAMPNDQAVLVVVLNFFMDCRVKPVNDNKKVTPSVRSSVVSPFA